MAEKEKQLLQSSNLLRQQLAHGRNIPVMVIVVIIILVIVIVFIIIVIIIFVTIIITNRFLKSSDRSRKLSKCPRKELVARLETNLRQQVCHPLAATWFATCAPILIPIAPPPWPPHPTQVSKMELDIGKVYKKTQ